MLIPRLHNDNRELPRLVLSLATLAAVGFSLVLFAQLSVMQLAPRSSYTLTNLLGAPGRNLLLFTLGLGMLLPAGLGLVLFWRGGSRYLDSLEYWATVLSPLALVFALPGLFLVQVAVAKPLFYLVMLSAFGLAMRALVAASWRASSAQSGPRASRLLAGLRSPFTRYPSLRLPHAASLVFVLLAATGYALYFGHYAIAHHRLIQTLDTDVGIADNLMSNLQHGRLFRAPAQFGTLPGNYLTVRAEYIALLFVPLYRLRPGAETLLWLQVALIALSVLPLFLLSRRWLGQRGAIWVSLAFFSLAPLHAALLSSFSWLSAFCLFSFTLYYAVIAERRWLIAFSLPATLASTEAGPLGVFAFGLFIGISCRKTRLAAVMCLLAASLFAVNTRLALHGLGSTQLVPPFTLGLQTLFTNPVYFVLDLARALKLAAILHLLAPLSLLPLSLLGSLPLVMPGLLFTSASNEFWPASPAAAQYGMLWVPGSILGVLFVLHRLRGTPAQRPLFIGSVIALSCTLLSHSYDFGLLLRRDAFSEPNRASSYLATPGGDKRYAELHRLIRRIPATASVVATTYMVSHVSNRVDVFDARRPYGEPDYVLLSTRELGSEARGPLSSTLSKHRYALVGHSGEFYLFRRGPETPKTVDALRLLGLLNPEAPANPQR